VKTQTEFLGVKFPRGSRKVLEAAARREELRSVSAYVRRTMLAAATPPQTKEISNAAK
jgi:hypothetical protein